MILGKSLFGPGPLSRTFRYPYCAIELTGWNQEAMTDPQAWIEAIHLTETASPTDSRGLVSKQNVKVLDVPSSRIDRVDRSDPGGLCTVQSWWCEFVAV